jgi:hypothetical protein
MKAKAPPETSQAPRGHHHFTAQGVVVGSPEIGTPWLLENVSPKRLFKTRKRRKRTPTDTTLMKQTEKATGRTVSGITRHPDGSRTVWFDGTVETGGGEAETADHGAVNGNPWDEVLHHGDR